MSIPWTELCRDERCNSNVCFCVLPRFQRGVLKPFCWNKLCVHPLIKNEKHAMDLLQEMLSTTVGQATFSFGDTARRKGRGDWRQ